ncbi:hypothetical protein [Paenibacillus ginsengihumi]|uniref:hypothetical protein n=1 Tax=Paenibacillus ginsengihumi TaxID=431596 RepID=UPI000379C601|nr:hypothetical protein [Paenibacillus ginsengihumi]
MRKENSDFKTAFVSEAGSHLDNRDYFAFVELDDLACYVIADGLDTDKEVRSAEMAVSVILENFMESPSLSRRKLKDHLETAHEWLKFESRRVRLKASVLVVITDYTRMIWGSCGNARLYHFRGGRLNFRSRDQSLSQLLLDQGRISEDRAGTHEERGNLLNYMGRPDTFEPFISKKTPLADGDVLLLCTPGIWEEVELPELLDALADSSDPETLTDTLEELVLSRQRSSVDNYTAAAVYANKIFAEKPKNRKKWILRIAMMLLALALAGGGIWYAKYRQAVKIAEAVVQMTEFEQDGDGYAAAGDYAKALKAYSEAKNAASKVKDKLHFQLIRGKQRVAQAVTDGDGYVKDGEYDMAVESYNKALEDADDYKVFKPEHIKERIDRSRTISKLAEAIAEGEKQLLAQDYNGALKTFNEAKSLAIAAGYDAGMKQADEKIKQAQEKIDNLTRETKTLRADNLEKKGDRSFEAEDYAGAMEAYAQAQEIYQEIEKLERVLAMERKIAKADEKLNPILPAAQTPDAGAAAPSAAAPSASAASAPSAAASAAQAARAEAATGTTAGGNGGGSQAGGKENGGNAEGRQAEGADDKGAEAETEPKSETTEGGTES